MDFLPVTIDHIQYFLLIFVRVSVLVSLLPILGAPQVPYQAKIMFALILTAVLYSTMMVGGKPTVVVQASSIGILMLLITKEMMVGFAVGYVASFLFTAVQFAGRLIDTEVGFGFVELADPFTDETITALGQFQVIIFTILFLLFNGHYFLILAIQKSFEIVPLTGVHLQEGAMTLHVTRMIADVFIVGIKLAAPIYITLILSEIAMGVVARTVPQINIFFVGMPLKIVVGMGTMFIVLPMLATLFKKMVEWLIQDIWKILYLMAPGGGTS